MQQADPSSVDYAIKGQMTTGDRNNLMDVDQEPASSAIVPPSEVPTVATTDTIPPPSSNDVVSHNQSDDSNSAPILPSSGLAVTAGENHNSMNVDHEGSNVDSASSGLVPPSEVPTVAITDAIPPPSPQDVVSTPLPPTTDAVPSSSLKNVVPSDDTNSSNVPRIVITTANGVPPPSINATAAIRPFSSEAIIHRSTTGSAPGPSPSGRVIDISLTIPADSHIPVSTSPSPASLPSPARDVLDNTSSSPVPSYPSPASLPSPTKDVLDKTSSSPVPSSPLPVSLPSPEGVVLSDKSNATATDAPNLEAGNNVEMSLRRSERVKNTKDTKPDMKKMDDPTPVKSKPRRKAKATAGTAEDPIDVDLTGDVCTSQSFASFY